jgi:hypothetical protein
MPDNDPDKDELPRIWNSFKTSDDAAQRIKQKLKLMGLLGVTTLENTFTPQTDLLHFKSQFPDPHGVNQPYMQREVARLKETYPDIADHIDAATEPLPSLGAIESQPETPMQEYSPPDSTPSHPSDINFGALIIIQPQGDNPLSGSKILEKLRPDRRQRLAQLLIENFDIHIESAAKQEKADYKKAETALIGLYANRDLMILEALGCRADLHAREDLKNHPFALSVNARQRFSRFFDAVLVYAPGENYERPAPGIEEKVARPLDPLQNLDRVNPTIEDGNLLRSKGLRLRNGNRPPSCYKNTVYVKATLLETK